MAAKERPLSPHLQIYNQGITGTLSIIHRITGVILSVGALLLAAWLVSVAGGIECFTWSQQILASWIGKLGLFAFSICLVYHLLNGIRHLFWDMGQGMNMATVKKTGYLVIVLSVILTALLWIVALRGGAL